MSPIAVIILIIVILVVIAAVAWGVQASRRKKLQSTFGPEYDRVVADTGSRADGEKELREREKRHAELELKPLSEESRARYAADWEEVQIQFVDVPEQAVTTADELVTRLIAERGYPTGDYDDQLANLSVEHAQTLGHYRDAHEISLRSQKGEASTEDLRQALVHYRALFADLLGTDPLKTDTTTGTPTADNTTTGTPATVDTAADTDDADTDRATDRADAVPAPGTAEADTRTTSSTSTPINDTDVAGTRPDATTR
jgi:hypothetical protein